jgi:hypothetical protein
MTNSNQLQQDLHYVRQVVDRADHSPLRGRALIYWLWALYVLIGCSLNDFAPHATHLFWSVGWITCLLATIFISRHFKKAAGIRNANDRSQLFWWGGSILIVLCIIGISVLIHQPGPVSGAVTGQISIVLVGIFYFLGGVHYDRNFLWLGPLLCACGLFVGLVPHYGWTALGIIFALGLVGPTFFASHPTQTISDQNLQNPPQA